jgi:hypothetical protein
MVLEAVFDDFAGFGELIWMVLEAAFEDLEDLQNGFKDWRVFV